MSARPALSPLLVAVFVDFEKWWYLPLFAAAGLGVLFAIVIVMPMLVRAWRRSRLLGTFWLFAGALVLYGIAETIFANWGTTLFVGHGVKPNAANDALAARRDRQPGR